MDPEFMSSFLEYLVWLMVMVMYLLIFFTNLNDFQLNYHVKAF